jgi:vacuolar protein sorting-associated protein 26
MSEPLTFEVVIKPETESGCPNIVQTGNWFDLTIKITVASGSTFTHRGIEAEFSSEFSPKGFKLTKLSSIPMKLSEAGSINGSLELAFPKCQILPRLQTYHGESFSVMHWFRLNVKKTFGSIDHSEEIISYDVTPMVKTLDPLCVRVAVAENIRIDLMINRRKFEVDDLICGSTHFLLVALKIKAFTVSLMAQELMEAGGKTKKHKNILGIWDITDGAPVKGEIIPFRIFLAPLKLSPSCCRAESGYTVTHFLHFSIITTSNERYFKALQVKIMKWPTLPFKFTDES